MRYLHRIWSLLIVILLLPCLANAQEEEPPDRLMHLVEEVRIGSFDGDEEYMFGSIAGVLPGKDGIFIVADPQRPIIRMYDREGNFIKDVGRQGRGPGEYNNVGAMGRFPDGGFAISDSRNSRVMIYDSQGEAVGSHTVRNNLHGAGGVFQTDHDGNFYVKLVDPESRRSGNWEFFWEKFSPEGEVVDTMPIPPEDGPEEAFVLITLSGAQYPFIEQTFSTLSPLGYLVTGRNTSYSLEWGTGSSAVSIDREYDPVTVKPEEKEQWEKAAARFPLDYSIPDTKPAYKSIFTDSQGRIWVWRYVEAEKTDQIGSGTQWWERPTFDVFMPDGTYHMTVEFPWRVEFRDARDDQVWGVVIGDMEEEYAVRFRLEEVSDQE